MIARGVPRSPLPLWETRCNRIVVRNLLRSETLLRLTSGRLTLWRILDPVEIWSPWRPRSVEALCNNCLGPASVGPPRVINSRISMQQLGKGRPGIEPWLPCTLNIGRDALRPEWRERCSLASSSRYKSWLGVRITGSSPISCLQPAYMRSRIAPT